MSTDAVMIRFGGSERKQRLTRTGEQEGFFDQGVLFWRNGIVRLVTGVALVLNIGAWGVFLLGVSRSREVVILHYNAYLGVDMVGAYQQLFIVPIIGLLFLGVNISLAHFLYGSQERIAAYMLLLAGVMLEFGVVVASVSLTLVNY
jgi:hypothetical protein